MKLSISLLLLIQLQTFLDFISSLNDRPIIGVLTQHYPGKKGRYLAFIAAPYVKFLEMAGARVVPIMVKQNNKYYEEMVKKTNGLLLPGGGRNISHSTYRDAAEALFNYSMKVIDQGEYYPIWSVCLGFQLITTLMAKYYHPNQENKDGNWLIDCKAVDRALKLNFSIDTRQTRLFANADENIIHILKTENVTPNYHNKCITRKNFTDSKLDTEFTIISTNRDDDDLEFISTFEHKYRPIYAVQWHPEKIPFEFSVMNKIQRPKKPQENIPHFYSAVLIAQYMANFFVNESRKNSHSFAGKAEEKEFLIYNFQPKFTWSDNKYVTEDKGEYFTQIYEFSIRMDDNSQILLIIGLCASAFLLMYVLRTIDMTLITSNIVQKFKKGN